MKEIEPISVWKLLEPFLFFYYLFLIANIFFLSGLDETHGDEAVYNLCDILTGVDTDSIRDVSMSFAGLFLLPLIFFLPSAYKNKKYLRVAATLLSALYWWWSFFGKYFSC